MKTLADRLSWARSQKGMTQGELARLSGVTQSTIGNLESGLRLSARRIANIAEALSVDTLWLSEGRGDPFPGTSAQAMDIARTVKSMPLLGVLAYDENEKLRAGRVPIRRYKEVRLSAGVREGFDGELDQREGGNHYLPQRFIEKHNLNPNLLFAVEVEGESMEDTLYEGNLVVVNRADTMPISGEIYAINVGDKATIKRLIRKGPMWHLSSDNPNKKAHPDISMAEAQGEVIGRVVWREGGL